MQHNGRCPDDALDDHVPESALEAHLRGIVVKKGSELIRAPRNGSECCGDRPRLVSNTSRLGALRAESAPHLGRSTSF